MPWNACTTAVSPASSRSRTATSSPSRPVNPGLRAGMFHTRGTLPGSRGPAPPSFRSAPRRAPAREHRLPVRPSAALPRPPAAPAAPPPRPSRTGHRTPAAAAPQACPPRARPPPAPAPDGPAPCPARAPAPPSTPRWCTGTGRNTPAENSATTRSHRASASLIASTKFWPDGPVPRIQLDGVPGVGQLPGHPLRPRPVRTGMTDEEISTIPPHTTSIPPSTPGRHAEVKDNRAQRPDGQESWLGSDSGMAR